MGFGQFPVGLVGHEGEFVGHQPRFIPILVYVLSKRALSLDS